MTDEECEFTQYGKCTYKETGCGSCEAKIKGLQALETRTDDKQGMVDEKDKYTNCKDFCPIYETIREYNSRHIGYWIHCPVEMCNAVVDAVKKYDEEKT